ncbi:MAG: M28 family peptidase [Chitinophagaceae bacterium]|nr:M28 family peptidase [Chitinophagaceae bacterium]
MQKLFSIIGSLFFGLMATAQDMHVVINEQEVNRVLSTLAADDMQGRRAFTPGIEKAAAFIAEEFRKTGLQKLQGSNSYLQNFTMIRPKMLGLTTTIDGQPVDMKNVVAITCKPILQVTESTPDFEIVRILKGANFITEARKYASLSKNYIVLVDTSFATNFSRLVSLKNQLFESDKSVIFILTSSIPKTISVDARHEINSQSLSNVVGVIPGKSLAKEIVIFSGHYDHLGIRKVTGTTDSIFNGANDDAAGTTAVIALANYFAKLNNNERTLIFAAFTAEEVGGYGATYFSRKFNPNDVKAMFNIEMIGTESKWGANSAYITGFEKTDMGKILQQNLAGTGFNFYPDPYPDQNLFYRSDNATLARLGVPAHTISTSKMDSEPNYHKVSDEVGTLNIPNMTQIIRSIALSARGIISGKETPSRVDVSVLR